MTSVTTWGLPPAQDVIETALAAATPDSDGCVVIVEDSSEVDVRFANNTTTTNGDRRDRRVTVVCFRETEGGMAAGTSRRGGDVDAVDLVHAALADAMGSPAADDAAPRLGPADVEKVGAEGAAGALRRGSRGDRSVGARSRARRGYRAPSNGPSPLGTSSTGSPSTGGQPSTWARRRECGWRTASRPVPSTWWLGAPTAGRRRGPGRARPASRTSPSRPSKSGWSSAWAGRRRDSNGRPGATRSCCHPTRWPTSWST